MIYLLDMQGKKRIFITLVIVIVVLMLLLGTYLRYRVITRVVNPASDFQPTLIPSEELATWVDQSEFSFQYPNSLKLDPHDEDQENYAHVELTSATHAGNLIVWTKDTAAENIDDWIKQAKIQGAIDSLLGGEPAKKVLTTSEPKKLTISAIRDGYLYQIETDLSDLDFWNKAYNTVSSTFKFASLLDEDKGESIQEQSPISQTYDDGEIFEEEEIIE